MATDLGHLDEVASADVASADVAQATLSAALTMLAAAPLPHTGRELAVEIASCERAVRRLEARKLRLLAAADQLGAAKDAGFTGTDTWLARNTHTDRREAARQVRLANSLDEQAMSATQDALEHGSLSRAHAAVIADAIEKLPTWLNPSQRHEVETALVGKAERFDPPMLRKIARRSIEALPVPPSVVNEHENNLLADEEERGRQRAELRLWNNADGTVSGRFTVPQVAGAVLRKVIDAMTSPRRAGIAAAKGSHALSFDSDERAHRAGEAFASLIERIPTDHLHHKTAATLLVNIDLETLKDQLNAAGLDTGDNISAGEARRLACGAGMVPVVLGGKSLPLDLGTSKRLFSEAQSLALATQHISCVADGCHRPYAWCELHHLQPWSHGGKTDLTQAVPLCNHHHQRIHDPRYHHRFANRSVTFSRRQ